MPPTLHGARLLAELQAQQPAMIACLREWVEIETPSREPDRVRRLAEAVARAFESAGCGSVLHPAALELRWPVRGAGAGPGADPRPMLVLGHLDTVYPVGTLAGMPFAEGDDPVHARHQGRCIFGPGVFDMKAGVVSALFALQALARVPEAEAPALPPLTFLFAFDEEIGSPGSRPLTERLARASRAALVLEPASGPGGTLKIARKGIARYAIAAHGVAAHSGLDFEHGASAVVELAAQIAELARWSDPERGVTVNPGLIAGGSAVNMVAADAHAEVEARAWTASDLDRIEQGVRALRPHDRRVRIEVSGGVSRPPMEASPGAKALLERVQALGAAIGLAIEATGVGGASDGNFTAALGLPTLDGLGAVGGGAHSPAEHIRLDALAPRTALLARLFAEL